MKVLAHNVQTDEWRTFFEISWHQDYSFDPDWEFVSYVH